MPSNTNNLNLYKKNPTTDGNDTFNIETMLNENWDKIDAGVKAVSDNHAAHLADKMQHITSHLQHNIISGDTNNGTETGLYYLQSGSANMPNGVTDGALMVMAYSTLWVSQMLMDWRTNKRYTRVKSNGVWGTWEEITGQSDYVRQPGFAVATGSANTYAVTLNPAPSAYVGGMGVSVVINMTNTGSSTLNVNGLGTKLIIDSKGAAMTAGKLKAGIIYTFRLNGANFILQGEGGEYGTATADKVLVGTTFGTDNGLANGTMPRRAGYINGPTIDGTSTPGNLFVRPLEGYYDGIYDWLVVNDPDFVADNILETKNIFGTQGAIPEKSTADNWTAQDALGQDGVIYAKPQNGYYRPVGTSSTPNNVAGWVRIADADFTPSNFPSNKNIFGLQGTMPNRSMGSGYHYALEYDGTSSIGRLYMRPPAGYYDGVGANGWVYLDDPNFIAANIKTGVLIFGRAGALQPKAYARNTDYGTLAADGSLTVAGLSFRPTILKLGWYDGYQWKSSYWHDTTAYTDPHGTGGSPQQFNPTSLTINSDGFRVVFAVSTGGGARYGWCGWQAWA